jgi:LPS-assembly lipoprotein
MPERLGQLLRQALQTRFDRAGTGAAKRYDLTAQFGLSSEALNIEQNTSIPSRIRLVGTANWSLVTRDAQRKTLTSGTARAMDGFNLYDQQFFASDAQSEAVQRQLAAAVADQITLQLAAWFNRHAAAE